MAAQHTPPNRGQRRPAPEGATGSDLNTATLASEGSPRCPCQPLNGAAYRLWRRFLVELSQAGGRALHGQMLPRYARRFAGQGICAHCGGSMLCAAILRLPESEQLPAQWFEVLIQFGWGPRYRVSEDNLQVLRELTKAARFGEWGVFWASQLAGSMTNDAAADGARQLVEFVFDLMRPLPFRGWWPVSWNLVFVDGSAHE